MENEEKKAEEKENEEPEKVSHRCSQLYYVDF